MNAIYIFDVDGVLCDRGQAIDPIFKNWFLEWSKDKTYYIVTGSTREKTISQIGEEILLNSVISLHCLGNNIWIKDHEVCVNKIELKPIEEQFLMNKVKESTYSIKTGNHLELRKGSINFSILGKNATQEQRLAYAAYDKQNLERFYIIKDFIKTFPRFEGFIGGDVSIDICLRGANKAQIFQYIDISKDTHFFGDRCFINGVDYPIFKNLSKTQNGVSHQINDGYVETCKILKSLCYI